MVKTTGFSYDANGNPLTTIHDDQHAEYAYDVRNMVEQVTNGESASDPDPKVTDYTYTPNGWTATEGKANGNTVTYDYYLDGLLKHQLETKTDGTVVAEHTIGWDGNGNRTGDVTRTRDADTGELRDRTYSYTYDPRDRVAEVTKTNTATGVVLSSESYAYDAASNVVSQTIDGATTSYVYDRNRLLTATTDGTTASYNHDPFGRLNTVTAAGQVIESYTYDGFDRIAEHTSIDENGASETTTYTYDAMDRTASRTDTAGETTDYTYLGLSEQVLNEEVAGQVQKSYQYSPWGKRLSQVTHNGDGTSEDGYYGYNAHTDVETVTDESGNPAATYGYTAYGKDDVAEFTGVDAPDVGTPGDEPYNVYRYNAKRFDPTSGLYDMGFRDYSPGLNRFLSRDMYTGALADLNLQTSPWTNNRYAFTGGNPTTFIEIDGHRLCEGPAPDCAPWLTVGGDQETTAVEVQITEPTTDTSSSDDCWTSGSGNHTTCVPDGPTRLPDGYQYNYTHHIGSASLIGSAEEVTDVFASYPQHIFPFEVEGCDEFVTGATCTLHAFPVDVFNSVGDVEVLRAETSVQFTVISDEYFDGPGSTVTFTLSESDGEIYLSQHADATDAALYPWLGVQAGFAKNIWERQAANLRSLYTESILRQDAWRAQNPAI